MRSRVDFVEEAVRVLLGFVTIVMATVALAVACGPAPEPQSMTVVMSDEFRFEPAVIRVEVGKPARVTVKNAGRLEHDFAVVGMPARDIRNATGDSHAHGVAAGTVIAHAKAQSEATTTFTATAKGSYEFFCSVAGHQEAGMQGTLEVE